MREKRNVVYLITELIVYQQQLSGKKNPRSRKYIKDLIIAGMTLTSPDTNS